MVGSGNVGKLDCFYFVLYLVSDFGHQICYIIVQGHQHALCQGSFPHSDILDRLSYTAAIVDISVQQEIMSLWFNGKL